MGTTRTRRKVKSKVGSLWIPGINCLLYFIDAPKQISQSQMKSRTLTRTIPESVRLLVYKKSPKAFSFSKRGCERFHDI